MSSSSGHELVTGGNWTVMSKYVSAYSYPCGFLGLINGQRPSSCHSQTFQHFRDQSGHWARDGRLLCSWSGYTKVGLSAGNRSPPSACNDPVVVVPVVEVVVVVLVVGVAVVADIVDHLHVMIHPELTIRANYVPARQSWASVRLFAFFVLFWANLSILVTLSRVILKVYSCLWIFNYFLFLKHEPFCTSLEVKAFFGTSR